jgi:hypothetical protein
MLTCSFRNVISIQASLRLKAIDQSRMVVGMAFELVECCELHPGNRIQTAGAKGQKDETPGKYGTHSNDAPPCVVCESYLFRMLTITRFTYTAHVR